MSFGHGALYALAAYTSVLLVAKAGWPWLTTIPAGILASLLGGTIIAISGFRVRAFYFALSTLAAGWIFFKILWNWVSLTGGQPGIPVPTATVAAYKLWENDFSWIIGALVLSSLIINRNIMISRTGRALKSLGSSETIAQAAGVSIGKYRILVFLISAFFAGLAGILYAYFFMFIDPTLSSLETSFSFMVILVIGGFASLFGPIIGAIVYVFLPAYLGFLQDYWPALWGLLLIGILLTTPKGLWGIVLDILSRKPLDKLFVANSLQVNNSPETWRGPTLIHSDDSFKLQINKVSKYFGGLTAVKDVDLVVEQGQIHSLIGPNGSGKTTLINMITGFYPVDSGEIIFENQRIDKLPPNKIVAAGIARTFQGAIVCEGMTTLDNVRIGSHSVTSSGVFRSAFSTKFARSESHLSRETAISLLKYVGILGVAYEFAENLGDGQRRSLEIARALASEPKILILDEPVAGLTKNEVIEVMQKLIELKNRGMAIILIEHHIEAVMSVSDKITVLNFGMKIAEGSPSEIRENEDVISAYLGTQEKQNAIRK
jgi:branched-chain amino acid transport system permease protein